MRIRKIDVEILRITDHKKNRKLVYLEEDTPAFCLYSKEIKKFGLKEGEELTTAVYDEIIELLKKRARERALYLLEDMPRTERQVRRKLKEGYYPDEASDYAVEYCRGRHYIDDAAYAERFIESEGTKYSGRMLKKKLMERGIDLPVIEEALEKSEVSEEETLRRLISRKNADLSDDKARRKLISGLLAKGFPYDLIRRTLSEDDLT